MKRGLVLCLFVACAPSERAPQRDVRRELASYPGIRLDGERLVRDRDRWRVGAIALPERANEAVQLHGGLAITAIGARDVRVRIEHGAAIYPSALRDADLVLVAAPNRVEELRLAHSLAAARSLRWALSRPARVVGDHLEVFDDEGRTQFRTEPAFAVDAAGRRVRVVLEAIDREVVARVEHDDELRYPIAIDPTWRAVNVLSAPRVGHATVRLPSGKIMVIGGYYADALSTTEIFDPATDTWKAGASMSAKRAFPSVTTLASGNVFVVGGCKGLWYGSSSAEIYDEATDTWTPAADALGDRGGESFDKAITLPSGKVFVITGAGSDIYDPKTNTWAVGPAHATGVAGGGYPVLLPSGKVLAIGARAAVGTEWYDAGSTVELYDPTSAAKASIVASMSTPRAAPEAVLLGTDKVLVAGGATRGIGWGGGTTALSSSEIYTISTNTWAPAPAMSTRRYNFAAALLPSGRFLVAGSDSAEPREGSTPATAELFDPVTLKWIKLPSMRVGRGRASMAALADGRALIAGGLSGFIGPWFGEVGTATSEIFEAKCAVGTDCASGNCVDGVCCDKPCTGACEACDEAGKVGTCSPISGAPRPAHPACTGGTVCKAGACATSCASSADCVNGAPCVAGACVVKNNGDKCASDAECVSRQCWDGVCCHTACDNPCVACDNTGKVGTCTIVTGLPHVDTRRLTCGKDRDCAKRCDGRDPWNCVIAAPAIGAVCSKDACIDGVETHAGTCDGVDTCSGPKKTCSPYACDLLTCKSKCGANTDCATGFVCEGTTCVMAMDAGVVDTGTDTALPADTLVADTYVEDTNVPDAMVPIDTAVPADVSVEPTEDQSLYGCSTSRTSSHAWWIVSLLLLVRRKR
jgi:hypothetical protein